MASLPLRPRAPRALTSTVLTACALLALAGEAHPEAAPSAASAKATGEDITAPLPELPKVPKSRFDTPKKEHISELDQLLERARHKDALIRERAVREILEVRPVWVDAIYHRLNQLADDADRQAMRDLLSKIRSEARNVVRQRMRAEGKTGDVDTPDYLTMVAEYAKPDSEAWKNLMTLLTMSRMLVAIGDVRAARALIHLYVRFGEFIRVDTQLQLEKLGDRSLAALIEARRHPAAKIGKWAERQLDLLGKAIPSETVQTEDPQVLADVLRAHGRIRDPDAARIVISFANSEKAQIRLAARQGVALLGEVGNWQLRDTYENIVGKKPRRDWSWKRTARELFGEFDKLRLARVHQLFDTGLAALKKQDYKAACEAFDGVLSHNPMFDRRDEMVEAYVAYAKALPKDELDTALLAARRAERANQTPKRQNRLQSLRLTLEAERALKAGVAEQVLFRRALELDPENQRARDALAMIERGESEPSQDYSRYYAALAIAGAALLAILLIALWRPRERPAPPEKPLEPEPGPQLENQSAPEPKPQPGNAGAARVEGEAETHGMAETETEAEGEAETHGTAEAEGAGEAATEDRIETHGEAEGKAETHGEAETEGSAHTQSDTETEVSAHTQSDTETEVSTHTQSDTETEVSTDTTEPEQSPESQKGTVDDTENEAQASNDAEPIGDKETNTPSPG